MDKQREIDILQSLKGDTYFAQYFGEDIDRMCQNIGNDFAIECGCEFRENDRLRIKALEDEVKRLNEELDKAKIEADRKVADLEEKFNNEKNNYVYKMLSVYDDDDNMNKVFVSMIGATEYLGIKLRNNFDLTDYDRGLIFQHLTLL